MQSGDSSAFQTGTSAMLPLPESAISAKLAVNSGRSSIDGPLQYGYCLRSHPVGRMPRLRLPPLLCFALALGAAGCKEDDGIRAYTVPKLRQSPPRLLAAMIPAGERVWFIKMSGAEPKIAAEKKSFEQFVGSLKFSENATAPLTWLLPDGWREAGGKTQTRFATLRAGPEALEVSITSLGIEARDVKSNVNRWRGQIGLKPVANDAELESISANITVDGKPATLIDMTGVLGESTAPAPREFSPNDSPARGGAPPSSPVATNKPVSFTTPAGWSELPVTGMRVAAFRVSD